ncbi:MAG TPA: PP2C family protein-serine/threonine phosphatase [Candidatus Nitrosotenuis sp.]|nr:PP2C family protein-serine/threonine phosphatase [Candidatus Nitrosotenuis sp.]
MAEKTRPLAPRTSWAIALAFAVSSLALAGQPGGDGAVLLALGYALARLASHSLLGEERARWLMPLVELAATTGIVALAGWSFAPLYCLGIVQAASYYSPVGAVAYAVAAAAATAGLDGPVLVHSQAFLAACLAALGVVAAGLGRQARLEQLAREEAQAASARAAQRDQLLEQELSIARRVQAALLPSGPPTGRGWRVAFRMLPARTVGGDLVQFFQLEGGIGLVVADVAGKGVPAAILVGSVHQLLHTFAHLPLPRLVETLNATLCHTTPDEISVAMTLAWFDSATGDVLYCAAGNPPPMVHRARENRLEVWRRTGLSLGWLPEERPEVVREHLEPGDTLLIYTDGLVDACDARGERIEVEGLKALVERVLGPDPEVSAEALSAELRALALADDATFVLLRRDQEPAQKAP